MVERKKRNKNMTKEEFLEESGWYKKLYKELTRDHGH